MVAEHVAMVGEENNERVVVQGPFLQSGQDSPDLFIDERHRSIVGPAGFFRLAGTEVAMP